MIEALAALGLLAVVGLFFWSSTPGTRLVLRHRVFGHPPSAVHRADVTARCQVCGDVWTTTR